MQYTFEEWLYKLDGIARKEGLVGSYTLKTGHAFWIGAYEDGMTPVEAWAKEKDKN